MRSAPLDSNPATTEQRHACARDRVDPQHDLAGDTIGRAASSERAAEAIVRAFKRRRRILVLIATGMPLAGSRPSGPPPTIA